MAATDDEKVKLVGDSPLQDEGVVGEVITGSGLTVNVTNWALPTHPLPVAEVGVTKN